MAAEQDRAARRRAWSVPLLVTASLVTLIATVNVWVDRQLLHTDNWVDVTDQLLADDDVREALSTYLVDELYSSVPVGDTIGELLPDDLERLGSIVAAALREPTIDAVERVLASDQVRAAWRTANRSAHELLVAVIEDDTGEALSTAGGAVTIDLGELVRAVGERMGLGGGVLDRLPDDAGVVVLFESDELELAQDAARLTERLATASLVLVVVLFAVAILLSVDRRRTVRDAGVGLVTVGVFVLSGRIAGVMAVADNLARSDDDEPAESILDIGTTVLRQIAITEILIGLALVVFAFLAGPASTARRIRSLLTPVLRHGTISAAAAGSVVFLVLLWLKPGGPITGWVMALTLMLLCVAGVGWIQRVVISDSAETDEPQHVAERADG